MTSISNSLPDVGVPEDVFIRHAKIIGDLEHERQQVQQKLKKARKEARADNIKLMNFDAMRRVADLTRDDQAEHMAHNIAYLRYLRVPVGTQLSLALDPAGGPDETDAEVAARVGADAEANGWRAGLAGAWEDDNPHEANSVAGQRWIKGYREAQKKAAAAMGEKKAAGADTGA